MRKLNTFVNVGGVWYGPSSRVPDEVVGQITNPDVWDGDEPTAAPAVVSEADEVKEPPRGGPGSSADAWRRFLQSKDFEVPEGASAKDMQAAWDARD